MELIVHFNTLPAGMSLNEVHGELSALLEEDGLVLNAGAHCFELELEDERANPKHSILTVKHYLQKVKFAPDTTIELAGMAVGIYE